MGRRFEEYRFRDGLTPLSADTFNPIFSDLDLRLDTVEKLQVDWEAAVAALTNTGLTKINEVLLPLIQAAQEVLLAAEIQLTNGACDIVYNEAGLVAEMNYTLDEEDVYSQTYAYDGDGNLTTESGKYNGDTLWIKTYRYDENDRLTGWTIERIRGFR